MKNYWSLFVGLLLLVSLGSPLHGQNPIPVDERIPDLNYYIVPGTMSYRLDGSNSPDLSDPDTLIRGHYYGYDEGGARTSWNSSQYLDFTFFQHPTNSNWITDPHQVDKLPISGNGGYNSSGSPPKWLGLNFRIAYPSSNYYTVDTSSKATLYPLIVFMHGAGERADCWGNNCYGVNNPNMWNNDHNLQHGGRQHRDAINRNPSDPRHWPGYVVFPQNKNGYNAGPGLQTWTGRVIALIEKLIEVYPIDPNRIYIHGLSEGAQGVWMLMTSRPDLFAAGAPMSGHRDNGAFSQDYISMDTSMIHIPIWQFQGGRDNRPSPEGTGNKIKKLVNMGGTPRYTVYPNLGHGVWNTAYEEPDFFSWFLQYSKLTIHGYYGIKEVCEGDPINVRLGVSKYFEAYEWRKEKDGVFTTVPPSPERDNEIIADEFASYQVRIMRDGVWSNWSEPYTISSRPRPSSSIEALGSTALPGLDGKTTVTLATDPDGIYYEWFRNGSPYDEDSTLNQLTVSQPGEFTMIKKDAGLCNSFESNSLYVSTAPYSGNLPLPPLNLFASPSSENSINLYWQDMSDNELGFEIYRSLDNITYQWIATTNPDALFYHDDGLIGDTQYFYKIRAFNANGPSAPSNVASATTEVDDVAPSAPGNFTFSHFGYREYRYRVDIGNNDADERFEVRTDSVILTWNSALDNVGIDHYEVYFGNGVLAATSSDTVTSVYGLDLHTTYNFYVVAIDANGNISSPSSNVSVTTTMDGLYYNLYAGGTWDSIREFSNWALFDDGFGTTSNFDIYSPKSGKYNDDDYFGYEFFGYIYIETEGQYTFYTRSDDGSRLWIGSDIWPLVENDGVHGSNEESGSIYLTPGAYPITVQYFDRSGGETLRVRWRGPGISRTDIPPSVLRSGPIESVPPPATPTNLIATAHGTEFSIDLTWNYNDLDIVVLGSSTAEGYGLGIGELSWVEKLDSTLTANNANYTLTNLAKGGYNTYYLRPDGSPGGSYAGAPDPNRNITKALSLNPDIIIVNMPSNNVADDIDIGTTMSHYQEMKDLADAAGVEIFFTTTQPRDFSNISKRHLLEDEANAVRQNFGQYVIDIYDELTDFSNDNARKPMYALASDNIHLNVLGHHYIFTEVINTVGPHIPKFELYESVEGGPFNIVHTTSYTSTQYERTGLYPSTNYSYKLKANTIHGSSAFSNTANAATAADTEPPSQPQNVTVRAKTSSQIALSWDKSTDNVEVTLYKITYTEGASGGGGGRLSSSSSAKTQAVSVFSSTNGVTVDNLSSQTEYTFTVSALDASANESLESDPLMAQTESNGPLPVEFLDFRYIVENKSVILLWKTASENNNSHFEVERANDIRAFSKIGELDGAGNSTDVLTYEYADHSPGTVNFYRIKQVDYDNAFSYSTILRVIMEGNPFDELRLYPNPTTYSNINIKGDVKSASDKISIAFADIIGKKHVILETDPESLIDGISINLNKQLKPGIYMVLISDGVQVAQKKLVIR